jgi:hypothetical protein
MATANLDVGGFKLAAEISGEGHSVVFSLNCGDTGAPWQTAIATLRTPTTCFDLRPRRQRRKQTPPDPRLHLIGAAADKLQRRIVATEIAGPYVLVDTAGIG